MGSAVDQQQVLPDMASVRRCRTDGCSVSGSASLLLQQSAKGFALPCLNADLQSGQQRASLQVRGTAGHAVCLWQ